MFIQFHNFNEEKMKKFILIVLIIVLSIIQVSVLDLKASSKEEKSNNKAGWNFYSADSNIEQLKN